MCLSSVCQNEFGHFCLVCRIQRNSISPSRRRHTIRYSDPGRTNSHATGTSPPRTDFGNRANKPLKRECFRSSRLQNGFPLSLASVHGQAIWPPGGPGGLGLPKLVLARSQLMGPGPGRPLLTHGPFLVRLRRFSATPRALAQGADPACSCLCHRRGRPNRRYSPCARRSSPRQSPGAFHGDRRVA